MERHKPTYDLSEVKKLVTLGRVGSTKRVRSFIENHIGQPETVVSEILKGTHESDFVKSVELNILPGTFADIYLVFYDSDNWYLKFYIDSDKAFVQVLSCNIDGFIH